MTEIEKPKIKMTWVEIITITIVVVFICYIIIRLSTFFMSYEKERFSCFKNQRMIADSILIYIQDHNGMLPDKATVWKDLNIKTDKLLIDPSIKSQRKGTGINNYAYNTLVSKKNIDDIYSPNQMFLTCDSDNPNNLWYSPVDSANRHEGMCKFSFMDGHVEMRNGNYLSTCKIYVNIQPQINAESEKVVMLACTKNDSTKKHLDLTEYDFDSVGGNSFMPELDSYNHIIMWHGIIKPEKSGVYMFKCTSDNMLFLDIGNNRLIEMMDGGSAKEKVKLIADEYYSFQLIFKKFKHTGKMAIRWTPPGGKEGRIPSRVFYTGLDIISSK